VEWRSILRHIVIAPAYPSSRWTELKAAAKELLDKTASPTSTVDPSVFSAFPRARTIANSPI
jgi:hypothetical protein